MAALTKKAQAEQERQEAIDKLRGWIKPGATIYTGLNHVSRSGMYRAIGLHIVHDGGILEVSWLAARAMNDKIDQRHGGIAAGGCGMDMGFDLVYNLGRTLYRDGFRCAGKKCPSSDHSNPRDRGVYNHETHEYDGYVGPMVRDGRSMHRGDGGYALNHRWI